MKLQETVDCGCESLDLRCRHGYGMFLLHVETRVCGRNESVRIRNRSASCWVRIRVTRRGEGSARFRNATSTITNYYIFLIITIYF
jgi:hypothetical protein